MRYEEQDLLPPPPPKILHQRDATSVTPAEFFFASTGLLNKMKNLDKNIVTRKCSDRSMEM